MNKERRANLGIAADLLREVKSKLEEVHIIVSQEAEAEREYYDNMPEGLQSGDKGTTAEEAATTLENIVSSLEEFDADDLISMIEMAQGVS